MITAVILAVLFCYLAMAIWFSRTQKPTYRVLGLPKAPESMRAGLGDQVSISTWNLGYAGLGADSDFIADRGRHLLPPSLASTRRNLEGILAVAASLTADISLYQEVSDASPLSYWAPLDQRLRALHANRIYLFQRDVATRLLFWPLRVCHGLVAASSRYPSSVESIPLPLESVAMMGLIRRQYALQVLRFERTEGHTDWTIVNLHLSAFDKDGLREIQLREVLKFAQAEYAAGRHVVIGGDWNLALTEAGQKHEDDEYALFWLRPFPQHLLPEGWTIAAPTDGPTVRTNHQPYVEGKNPTATIDGFLISPNVRIDSIERSDTGFAMSDHMPVLVCVSAH